MVTLAVLTGLVALVGVLASNHGTSMQAETNRMAMRRAQLMAEAGIQRAIAEIQSQAKGPVTLNDSWATLGNSGATEFTVGSDSFRIQVIDAASRININIADHDTLAKLPMTSDQVDSLLDWREKTLTPRPSGAKDSYYNGLTKPYNTKLQPFGSVDELLQVKGFTPATLLTGASPALADLITIDSTSNDLDLNGNQKIDITSATALQLTALGISSQIANTILQSQSSFTKMGDVLQVQGLDQASAKIILNSCQVHPGKPTPGLININTASQTILSAIPGIESDIASAIVNRQSSGFKGLGDLVDIPGLSLANLASVVDRFAVSSQSFELRSLGFAAGITAGIDAVIQTDGNGTVTIVREQPTPFIDPVSHWGWPTSSSERVTLAGAW